MNFKILNLSLNNHSVLEPHHYSNLLEKQDYVKKTAKTWVKYKIS